MEATYSDRNLFFFVLLLRSNFVYQPAMALVVGRDDAATYVGDEGVAFLSRFPIASVSYKLLPRHLGNPNDMHQRICLRAKVQVTGPADAPEFVEVFTTHLSLDREVKRTDLV